MEKVIKLTGRIDTNNIDEVEKNIKEEIKDFKGELVFDADELEYISSAGLRMILRMKKDNDNTKIINCSKEIYDVFEMTGFSEMMDISKTYRKLSIDGCEVIGDGFYGTVYRIDPETIVKVYKKPDSLEMVKREKDLSRKAFVLGIPTAIPYDIVRVGDNYGSVFELLNCRSLEKAIQEGEDVQKLAKKCVDILKKIHSIKMEPGELPNKKEQMIEMANNCKDYLSKETLDKLISLINGIPDTNTMIHGDFHIKNLMEQDDELLIIDMDTLSMGSPIFELSAIYATYEAFACVNKNNPQEFLGITYEQSKTMCDTIFELYYKDTPKNELEEALKLIKLIAYLKVLFIRTKFINKENKYQNDEIEFCKKYITENV